MSGRSALLGAVLLGLIFQAACVSHAEPPQADGMLVRVDGATTVSAVRAGAATPVPIAVGDVVFKSDEISVAGGSATILVSNGAVWTLRGGQRRKLVDSLAWNAKVVKTDVLFAVPSKGVSVSAGRLAGIDPGTRVSTEPKIDSLDVKTAGAPATPAPSATPAPMATSTPKGGGKRPPAKLAALAASEHHFVVSTPAAPPATPGNIPSQSGGASVSQAASDLVMIDYAAALNALPMSGCGKGRAHAQLHFANGRVDEVVLSPGEGSNETMLNCLGDALRDLQVPGANGSTIDVDVTL